MLSGVSSIGKLIKEELCFLLPRAAVLDAAAYLIFSAVIGSFSLLPLTGLLAGTAAMLINTTLLAVTIHKAVQLTERSAKKLMMFSYCARFALLGCLMTAGFLHPQIVTPAAVVVPLFYPRLAHTLDAVFHKKKGGKADGN